jgi:hypothetical protein
VVVQAHVVTVMRSKWCFNSIRHAYESVSTWQKLASPTEAIQGCGKLFSENIGHFVSALITHRPHTVYFHLHFFLRVPHDVMYRYTLSVTSGHVIFDMGSKINETGAPRLDPEI